MDDWEDSDFVIPIINSKEQLKQLEERKLMEESNNKLIEDLFSEQQMKRQEHIQPPKPPESEPKKNKFNNNKINEMKQKEVSRKIKEDKEKMKKDIEMYGDNNYEYNDYEDKFYNE
jgi:hypothetical protein